ncbi:lactate racemase domain-containing protein [Chloroflexota bacterium]
MTFPQMFRIRQELNGPALEDVPLTIRENMASLNLKDKIKAGQSVAITAGSRGITGIAQILLTVVNECKTLGLMPFIVPAMGSHGGATAEGQRHILQHYGITKNTMGCEVKSSMDVVRIGETIGIPVFCDKNAWEADHIAVVGRVKPHTDFDNEIESGLFKMMSIGLGKQKGAEQYHRAGHDYSYAEVFPAVGQEVLNTGKILFGLAIVENGYDQTARAEAVLSSDFYEKEKELLLEAKAWLGRLPFEELDLLIVDEIGKDISGTGLDPNVIGRTCIQKHPESPKIRHLLVRDITEDSDGNAIGIGMADFTTKRLVDKISREVTYMNVLTAGSLSLAKIPISFDSDKETIGTALGMLGLTASQDARIVRIKNTLNLTEMDVSEPLQKNVSGNKRLSVLTDPAPIPFDIHDNLPVF